MGSLVIPSLRYHDAPAAIDWLCDALGFQRHLVVPDDKGGIAHAQLVLGDGMIMLGSVRDDEYSKIMVAMPSPDSPVTQSIYLIVDDVDGHYRRALEKGAVIVSKPTDQPYGGRLYSCRDLEGHFWNIGSYNPWRAEH
ncbi:MAG: VOC family protein [Acidobacteria bacterium]|nr:VOC family protein [Acidobacteriota bacterium]